MCTKLIRLDNTRRNDIRVNCAVASQVGSFMRKDDVCACDHMLYTLSFFQIIRYCKL